MKSFKNTIFQIMKSIIIIIFTIGLFSQLSCTIHADPEKELNPSTMLWYENPANGWTEALPIGNGRLGAMIYGGVENETIQFNEETLWTGQPHDYAHQNAHEVLDDLRQLLWDGKQDEAHQLGNERFMSQPFGQLSYQPFGNILLTFPEHRESTNYQRKLDLENAISSLEYAVNGVKYKREIFASNPDQAIIVRLESSKKGALSFTVTLDSPHSNYDVTVEDNEIIIKGSPNNYPEKLGRDGEPYPASKLTFEARLKVINEEGSLVKKGEEIEVLNANTATLQLVAATSFVNYQDISENPMVRCKKYQQHLEGKPYHQLKETHSEDHQRLFGRVNLDLGKSELSSRPTNKRLTTFKQDEDPDMVALLFQYGRYLLIASSREGTQPANLQGIWNDKIRAPWDSKYTININTEMNYWPAEITNLSELVNPLIAMVGELAETGQSVAKEHYNLNGWVVHHNTDIWRGAAPINNANHGIWVAGGAWLCQHLWWHYQFTGDKELLKNTVFPILKEASKFFVEYLVPDPNNQDWLVSGPSNSPEIGGLVMGPTMDHQIIRNLLGNTIEAAQILEIDFDLVQLLKETRNKIAPNLIGQHGQLQEWLIDNDDPENKHRHVSHLWGLHPGNEIHPLITPELAAACKVTLAHRGDGGTGWSRAWKINFWARLLDGDHSFLLLKNLMVPSISQDVEMKDNGGLYMNLFDSHPPFQIDGNFGATSGITEMLLQSHLRDDNGDFFQDILPALPAALASGEVSGIKGRGGFEFTIKWKNEALVSVEIKSHLGNILNVRYNGMLLSQETSKGESYSYTLDSFNN